MFRLIRIFFEVEVKGKLDYSFCENRNKCSKTMVSVGQLRPSRFFSFVWQGACPHVVYAKIMAAFREHTIAKPLDLIPRITTTAGMITSPLSV